MKPTTDRPTRGRAAANHESRSPAVALEPLEPRRLLAVVGGTPLADGFTANVNFQPAATGPVAFTHADFGRPYGVRGNGLSYGWDRDLSAAAVDRDSPRDIRPLVTRDADDNAHRDERFDTYVAAPNGASWRIAVPDGCYAVVLVSGDPDYAGGIGGRKYRWSVNGQPTMNALPVDFYPWGEGIAYVVVTDGQIRVSADDNGLENNLMWLRVAQLESLPTYEQGAAVAWSQSPVEAPTERIESGAARVGDQLYVIGGFLQGFTQVTPRVDVLDLATLTWSAGPALPPDAAETHAAVAVDAARGHVYWIGGQLGGDEFGESYQSTAGVFRLEVATNRWTRLGDLPAPRYAAGAEVVGDVLYVFGGADASRLTATRTTAKLDLSLLVEGEPLTWVEGPAMPREVNHLASAVLDGRIYAVGGEHGHGVSQVSHRDVQIYDPSTDAWSVGQMMPEAASHIEAAMVEVDGALWVLGGQTPGRRNGRGVYRYDPAADAWTLHTALPSFRRGGFAFVDLQGRFHYLTGDDYNEQLARGGWVGVVA